MEIPLKPELAAFIAEEVRAGRYLSEVQVVEAALARLMLDPPPDEELDEQVLRDIAEADAEIERGEGIPAEEAFAQLRAKHFGK